MSVLNGVHVVYVPHEKDLENIKLCTLCYNFQLRAEILYRGP